MQEFRDALSAPPHQLIIFSPARSIEHVELQTRLQRTLPINCALGYNLNLTGPQDLILFDCREVSALRIEQWLLRLQQQKTLRQCALLNMEQNSEHEGLVDWPNIRGVFFRNCNGQQLLSGLNEILQGKLALPNSIYQAFMRRLRRPPSSPRIRSDPIKLTRRELQILEGIYSGYSNARIADYLSLSEHTIKSHLSNAYRKLGISSRLEACTWMREHYAFVTT